MASSRRIAVCLEVSLRETIASALNWPGWCRAGRDDGGALKALASYAVRYAPVARQAARRMARLVIGAWATFDEIAAASPAELRKGPRGGELTPA